jgi:hypothetical protein
LIPNTISLGAEHESPSAELGQLQLERILESNTFRNAVTLRHLLQFLASQALEGNSDGVKEYTIGTEVFGRKPDFDPKTDPIVRVQIHRLRHKLGEYYDAEGTHDPILVEIPKGHYLPRFDFRAQPFSTLKSGAETETNAEAAVNPFPEHKIESVLSEPAKHSGRSLSSVVALSLAGAAIFAVGVLAGNRQARVSAGGEAASLHPGVSARNADNLVKTFWTGFLGNDPAPIIAYPDAVFLLDDSNDLFRFREGASDGRGAPVDPHLARQFASNPSLVAKAGQLYYENGYTGTGELESVAMLTSLFAQMGVKATIKSSRDITPDDLKQHNVILLGSPFQNIAVAQLLAGGDFSFRNPDSHREQWRAQILNAHPQANESSIYRTERDPKTQVLKADYSVVTIQPSIVPRRYIAIIGGLDTKGTEGATLFATSRQGMEELFKALAASGKPIQKDGLPAFQALVQVRIENGYQVLDAKLTTMHLLHPQNAPESGNSSGPPSASN